MLQVYLLNALIFCAILLLLAVTVASVQIVLILIDVRKMTNEIKEKLLAITTVLDVVTLVIGGLGAAKKKFKHGDSATFVGFMAGLKRALQAFLKKGGE